MLNVNNYIFNKVQTNPNVLYKGYKMITQYETENHYVLVEDRILNHPFSKSEKCWDVRCGTDFMAFTKKSEIKPYIENTYGKILKTLKY